MWIIGARRVDKAFADMIKAIFSIGDGAAKIPGVNSDTHIQIVMYNIFR